MSDDAGHNSEATKPFPRHSRMRNASRPLSELRMLSNYGLEW